MKIWIALFILLAGNINLSAQEKTTLDPVEIEMNLKGNPLVKKYGITTIDRIYLIGWAADGKIAVIMGVPAPFRPDYLYSLVIQDMVTDKIAYTSGEKSMMNLFEDQGVKDPPVFDEDITLKLFLSQYQKEMLPVLEKYKIVYSKSADYIALPAAANAGKIDVRIAVTKKKLQEWDTTNVYKTYEYDLIVTHSAFGKKTVAHEKYANDYIFTVECFGLLKSPFEDRAALIVTDLTWGLENENRASHTLRGCHLSRGFKK